ncbi:MAG: DUF6580 family putative transport protein [bacterium]
MKITILPRRFGSDAGITALVACCIFLLAAFRVLRAGLLPELPNFSPVSAVAFCGGLFLPGIFAWIVPVSILFVSDVALAALIGYPVFSSGQFVSWGCMLMVVAAGRLVSKGSFSILLFFSGLIGSGILFYILTNTAAWIENPAYPRGLDGLWMSLTTGLPGFAPSWVFFRNAISSDLIFGLLLLGGWALARRGVDIKLKPSVNQTP